MRFSMIDSRQRTFDRVLLHGSRFGKAVGVGTCSAVLALSLAGCAAQTVEDSASQQPKTDLYASQQAFASEDMKSDQAISQIDALSAYADYTSDNQGGENLHGADALAFDLFLEAFASDPSNASIRIAQGGLYVPSTSAKALSDQVQDAVGDSDADDTRQATGWPTFDPSEEQSKTDASSCPPLFGFAAELTGDTPSAGSLYVFDPESMVLVDVSSDLQFALSSGYSSATDYAAVVSAGRLAQLPGRNATDFAQTVWCTMKTHALDYDAINAALDEYWSDTRS